MKDKSIFDGVREFANEAGKEFRAVYKGCKMWHVYVLKGQAYIFDAVVEASSKAKCKTLYKKIMEN